MLVLLFLFTFLCPQVMHRDKVQGLERSHAEELEALKAEATKLKEAHKAEAGELAAKAPVLEARLRCAHRNPIPTLPG